ncbi:translation initiation factor IF-2 [Gallus gallus]|uniref:translation initiation factor IF-2 n=1 Tax=Gallus gallus TaxID=9031 RepID=UPI001F011B27|nr:translation initiation factor IF-2 [Gallus gallus]
MLRRPGAARAGPGERGAGRRLDERCGAAPPRAAPRRRPPRASSASSRCGVPRSLRGRGTLGMRGRHFARGARGGGSARAARPGPGQPRSTGPSDPAHLPRSRSAATEWLRQPCGGSRGSPRRGGGWRGGRAGAAIVCGGGAGAGGSSRAGAAPGEALPPPKSPGGSAAQYGPRRSPSGGAASGPSEAWEGDAAC